MYTNAIVPNTVDIREYSGQPMSGDGASARNLALQDPQVVARDVLDISPEMTQAIRASREGGDVLDVLLDGPGNERNAALALINYMFQNTALGMEVPPMETDVVIPEAIPPAPLLQYTASMAENLPQLDLVA